MACACKVNTQINKIQEKYGVNEPTVKTNIKGQISIFFKNLAGLPPQISFSGIFLATTEPAATTAPCPIFVPDIIVAP